MIILGISEAHEAHACIVQDGKLVAAIAEERLTRLKMDSRYPRQSIDAVLRIAGITADQIDAVSFASSSAQLWHTLYNKHAMFSVQDWIQECDLYWRPKLLEGKDVSPFFVYDHFSHHGGPDLASNPYYPLIDQVRNAPPEHWERLGWAIRTKTVMDHLGVSPDKIHCFRHEDCHKAYGFYSSPYDREKALLFTLEGGGDDSSATISTIEADGSFTEHWASNDVQAGRLYAYVTLILGMKPCQHEYKVMGLAPYGNEYHGGRSLDFFRKINHVAGTEIINDKTVKDLYFSVQEAIRGERFDGIAWGLQTWLEEIVCDWVCNNIEHHGINNVIISGGVAQNIKAVKALAEKSSVGRLWAGPISGDGSIGVGAAWLAHQKVCPDIQIEGLTSVYLGTTYGEDAVAEAIQNTKVRANYSILSNPSADDVATWLDDGLVVSRYSGKMEFGQRALGNRSILADPRRPESVDRINQKIKYRDFWMPFTPSMTFEQSEKMLRNEKGLYSPFMTMAFDLKPEFQKSIPAAMHPADQTVRPQMLKREVNPGYYDLIEAFGKRTGLSCVMNTSFNLHGEAIVETPEDAISTFERSEIDILLFDGVAISRSNLTK